MINISWKKLSRMAFLGVILLIFTIGSPTPGKAIVAMEPCKELAYSFSEDFVMQDDPPLVISDGDLIGANCAICARNADLLAEFDINPAYDLGLDAVDVLDGDGFVVAFSTELDSSNQGMFTAGDLLVTKGTILSGFVIIPNQALTYAFNQGAIRVDLGLDAVHFIGEPERIIQFLGTAALYDRGDWLAPEPDLLTNLLKEVGIDIWFSTEGTAGPITTPLFLDGDALSARDGLIISPNRDLLPLSAPAGIPVRGVDFGLDALTNNRTEDLNSIHFSTEILYQGETGFNDGDVLKFNNGIVIPAQDLVNCFQPLAGMMGLDALYLGSLPTNAIYLPVIINQFTPE